jgi:hypothetical protein
MRTWMIVTGFLCRQHLLGEHGEIHKHRPSFVKQHSITGRRGQIEPLAMATRHDALAAEMVRRGMNHKSPYQMPDLSYLPPEDREGRVCVVTSFLLLMWRCSECRKQTARFLYQRARQRVGFN